MRAIAIIPARYDSTRLPGKVLYPLQGKSVIHHVFDNCKKADLVEAVIVATDNQLIVQEVESFGGRALMTSPEHKSGTNRIAEALMLLENDYDVIVNVQGDEPLIQPEMINDVVSIIAEGGADIGTLAQKIDQPNEIFDPNIVKVVFDKHFNALYFSRAPIPFHRDEWANIVPEKLAGDYYAYRHIGIYSYAKEALLEFAQLKPSRLEEIEKLEQLCALENGFKIKVRETSGEIIGVDTREDLEKVSSILVTRQNDDKTSFS